MLSEDANQLHTTVIICDLVSQCCRPLWGVKNNSKNSSIQLFLFHGISTFSTNMSGVFIVTAQSYDWPDLNTICIYSVEQIVWVVFAQALSAIKTATRVDALCSREMWPKMYREPKRQNLWECNLYKLCHPARTTTEVTKIEMGNAIWFMNSHMLLILHRTDSSLRLHINNSLPKL